MGRGVAGKLPGAGCRVLAGETADGPARGRCWCCRQRRGGRGGLQMEPGCYQQQSSLKGPCSLPPMALAAINNQSAVRMAFSPPLRRKNPMRTRQPHFTTAAPAHRGWALADSGVGALYVHKVQLQVASAVAASGASAAASLVLPAAPALAASILLLLAPGACPCWCCCCIGE